MYLDRNFEGILSREVPDARFIDLTQFFYEKRKIIEHQLFNRILRIFFRIFVRINPQTLLKPIGSEGILVGPCRYLPLEPHCICSENLTPF